MPTSYLFLLFLLVLIPLAALLWKMARNHGISILGLIAHALVAPHEGQLPTIMSDLPVPRGDEEDRWRTLIPESDAAVEKYLFPEIDIELATFIRCVTFRAFSVVFLNVNPDALVFAEVQRVTGAVSEFYNDGNGRNVLSRDVQDTLNEWFPGRRLPHSLDRIFPAYEMLWRTVATIVVTCEGDQTKRWIMLDFRDNPRDGQYSASSGGDERSVAAITNNAVHRLTPIARLQHRAAHASWPLSRIQNATPGHAMAGSPPTVREALKFAALLAATIVGRVGLHYQIVSVQGDGGSQASPWVGRKIVGGDREPDNHSINTVDKFPHTSTARQAH